MQFFSSDEILKLFKKYDKEINKLYCALEECCEKHPINIGSGLGLYKDFYKNHWRFKSLIAGDNITLQDTGNEIVINSTGGGSSFNCNDLLSCSTSNLPEGSNLYFTNERAQDAVGTILTNTSQITFNYNDVANTISASFASNLISQFTNDAGYITSSGASLTSTYVGYGSNTNTLTGNSDFIYDNVNNIFKVGWGSTNYLIVDIPNQYAKINNGLDNFELNLNSSTIQLGGNNILSLNRTFGLYSIGASGFDLNTHILIDDTFGNENIQLNSTNGVIVSNLATGGTEMVVANSTGLLSKQAIPTGTVTNVQLSSGTGISLSGTNPITTSGTITVTNTAPDQTVILTQGGTTTITGTYPNFTISSADQFTGTVTSVSALTIGTTGTDLSSTVANSTTTPVITLNVPTASASNRGALSAADWSTFNSKEPAITWSQGDILYGTGVNAYTKLAKNTSATRYLSNTGTSNNPAWAQIDLTNGVTGILPGVNGGGFVLISTATASNSSTIDFEGLSSSYKTYVVIFDGVVPTVNPANFVMRVGTGSAPVTYQTGNVYSYQTLSSLQGASSSPAGGTGVSSIQTGAFIGNAANDTVSGMLYIRNPSQTTKYHQIDYQIIVNRAAYAASGMAYVDGAGTYLSTTAVTAIRIFMDSGNISTGNFYLYGIQ